MVTAKLHLVTLGVYGLTPMAPSKIPLRRDVDQFRVFLYLLDAGEDVESLAAPFLKLGWIVEAPAGADRRYVLTIEGERIRQ